VIRILQITHLFLIVVSVALYAWLMAELPTDDPWRVRISAAVAIGTAVWGALVFIEALRSGEEKGFKERCMAAYRRLLSRLPTLVASTVVLGAVAAGLLFLAAAYGEIEFSSNTDQDVAVFLSDPGEKAQRVALIPAGKRITARLPVGRRSIFFQTASGKPDPYRTAKIDVFPIWRAHDPQTIAVPEVPKYVGQ
jgi:hypothetical protein